MSHSAESGCGALQGPLACSRSRLQSIGGNLISGSRAEIANMLSGNCIDNACVLTKALLWLFVLYTRLYQACSSFADSLLVFASI
jgi:hypothetical protein